MLNKTIYHYPIKKQLQPYASFSQFSKGWICWLDTNYTAPLVWNIAVSLIHSIRSITESLCDFVSVLDLLLFRLVILFSRKKAEAFNISLLFFPFWFLSRIACCPSILIGWLKDRKLKRNNCFCNCHYLSSNKQSFAFRFSRHFISFI